MMGLRRITDAESLAAHNPNIGCVFSPLTMTKQAFFRKSSQQSETDGSFQAGALHNIRQGKRLPVILEQAKNGTCAGNGFKSVLWLEWFCSVWHGGTHCCIVPIQYTKCWKKIAIYASFYTSNFSRCATRELSL
jgi:hypothetical protein